MSANDLSQRMRSVTGRKAAEPTVAPGPEAQDRSTYRITVDLPSGLYDTLRLWAFEDHVPASRIIRALLTEASADTELAQRVRSSARTRT
jgi:hypothetical protein